METRNALCGLMSGRLGWPITQPCAPLWTRVKARLKMPPWLAGLAAAGMCVASANGANSSVIFVNTLGPGSQTGLVLGMDFVVHSTVTVTEMGVFDSDGDGFFDGDDLFLDCMAENLPTVGIYRLSGPSAQFVTGTLIASSEVSFCGADPGVLDGGSRFKPVTPFDLVPGNYSIVASGFEFNRSGNTGFGTDFTSFDDLSGALTVVSGGGRSVALL